MKILLLLLITSFGCESAQVGKAYAEENTSVKQDTLVKVEQHHAPLEPAHDLRVGAARFDKYLTMLEGQRVGIIANHTSLVGDVHLVDTLLELGVSVQKVFAPEHGFRGDAANGETVASGTDPITGLAVVSLYGSNKKPTATMLEDMDVLLFDIQDVGARFYTYISTMHLVMEAAAETGKKVIILDRPNPNGFYVDGPVLEPEFQSFVGMHPIPVVHGLTVGELAKMIQGEKWLQGGIQCDLEVILCEGYSHRIKYELPVAPSPNLPNMTSVYLYPSLCFFEPTKVSVGRGTDVPFQVIGYPGYGIGSFAFTPRAIPGKSLNPKYEGESCTGHNLTNFASFYFFNERELYLDWLVEMHKYYGATDDFFTSPNFFDKLCGTRSLREQLKAGKTADEIRASWQPALKKYKSMRKNYLLYVDFE